MISPVEFWPCSCRGGCLECPHVPMVVCREQEEELEIIWGLVSSAFKPRGSSGRTTVNRSGNLSLFFYTHKSHGASYYAVYIHPPTRALFFLTLARFYLGRMSEVCNMVRRVSTFIHA
ncbi:unnamed protein product, partial [Ectocarpus sp. 12 AP-2014]